MKTFRELNSGDKIYYIDEDFRVREKYVTGLVNPGLREVGDVHVYILGSDIPIVANGKSTACTYQRDEKSERVRYLSCLESAKLEHENLKQIYINRQFDKALQAFRRIKKISKNDKSLQKRVFDLFQIKEE